MQSAKTAKEGASQTFMMAVFLPQLHEGAHNLCECLRDVMSNLEGLILCYKTGTKQGEGALVAGNIAPKQVTRLRQSSIEEPLKPGGVIKHKGSPLPKLLNGEASPAGSESGTGSPMAALQAGWNITSEINQVVDGVRQEHHVSEDLIMQITQPQLETPDGEKESTSCRHSGPDNRGRLQKR